MDAGRKITGLRYVALCLMWSGILVTWFGPISSAAKIKPNTQTDSPNGIDNRINGPGELQNTSFNLSKEVQNSSINGDTSEKQINPWWREGLDVVQLILALFGVVANIVTFITLMTNGSSFSPAILTVLRHQSAVDCCACLCGALLLVQPDMWLPGNYHGNFFICYAWHGQAIYWNVVFISVWNLVVLAFERFLAVKFPFKHKNLTPKILCLVFLGIYICSFGATCGAYIQTRLMNGTCLPEYHFQGGDADKFSYYAFSISTFFTFYALPCALFVILYGLIIAEFRMRPKNLAASRIIDKATSALTKTAVVVTAIFAVSIGYDLWYYMLGYAGLVEYVVGSPIQKVGILLATFNSVANPFVYALLIPAYRKSVKATFWSCWRKKLFELSKSSEDPGTSSLAMQESKSTE